MTNPAVVVCKYPDEATFQGDAQQLAGKGYRIAAQSWGTTGLSGAGKVWFVLSAVMAVAGFLFPLLWIAAIVMLLVAMTGRHKVLTVTYQLT